MMRRLRRLNVFEDMDQGARELSADAGTIDFGRPSLQHALQRATMKLRRPETDTVAAR
jgi:hypothetical protein